MDNLLASGLLDGVDAAQRGYSTKSTLPKGATRRSRCCPKGLLDEVDAAYIMQLPMPLSGLKWHSVGQSVAKVGQSVAKWGYYIIYIINLYVARGPVTLASVRSPLQTPSGVIHSGLQTPSAVLLC